MYSGFQGMQGVCGFLAFFQADRLQHGDTVLLCQLFNRGSLQLHAPASGAVGLGQHQVHWVTGSNKLRQRNPSKLGCASETHIQGSIHGGLGDQAV